MTSDNRPFLPPLAIAALAAFAAAILTTIAAVADPSLTVLRVARSWAFWTLVCTPVVVLAEIMIRSVMRPATVQSENDPRYN